MQRTNRHYLLVTAGLLLCVAYTVAGELGDRRDGPRRDEWQRPAEVIHALRLAPDAIIADIGAGSGYFALRLARAVPNGRVYAVDIEPEIIGRLRENAAREGITNLTAIQATRDSPGLPEAVDLALLVNVQGLIVRPGDYFARLSTNLRPGGRVAIIAWQPDAPIGAPSGVKVPAEHVQREMARQGYRLAASHNFLPYQYFLVFTPSLQKPGASEPGRQE